MSRKIDESTALDIIKASVDLTASILKDRLAVAESTIARLTEERDRARAEAARYRTALWKIVASVDEYDENGLMACEIACAALDGGKGAN